MNRFSEYLAFEILHRPDFWQDVLYIYTYLSIFFHFPDSRRSVLSGLHFYFSLPDSANRELCPILNIQISKTSSRGKNSIQAKTKLRMNIKRFVNTKSRDSTREIWSSPVGQKNSRIWPNFRIPNDHFVNLTALKATPTVVKMYTTNGNLKRRITI